MRRMNRRAGRMAGLAAVACLVLAGCGGGNIESADAPAGASECDDELNMAINPWVGYEASAHVVGYVARTELGCEVEYKPLKEELAWQGFGSGDVDVVIENWGHADLKKKYIQDQKTGVVVGPTGNTGIIGWYVPPWLAKEHPEVLNWKNLNKFSQEFATSESGGQGQLLDGDPSFVTNDEALVKNLNLDFKVVYAGSEPALIQAFRQAEANKDWMIGYFYEPQWLFEELPLKQVQLPPYKPAVTPTRSRSTASTRRTTWTRSRAGSTSRPAAPAPSWSRTSSGPTPTRTWSPATSRRTGCRPRPRPRSGSRPTWTRCRSGCPRSDQVLT